MEIRRIGSIKKGEDVIGNRTSVKIVKNKLAPPFRKAEFNIMYGVGISRVAEVLDLAVEMDIIQKRGSWYRYNGDPIGQGSDAAIQYLTEDKRLFNEIYETVKKSVLPSSIVGSAIGEETEAAAE
jgi:recombination protein RecA